MKVLEKKTRIDELIHHLDEERTAGKKIVLCLGVFDLVHPGHIRHLQEAKEYGDILVVAVTANRYVNKGPDRPVFNEQLRMESIAAIECVDFVVLNDYQGGIDVIDLIKPHFYVKGIEYKDEGKDITDKIRLERETVEKHNGQLVFTNDIVFSSSKLLNSYFNETSKEFRQFIYNFKSAYSFEQTLSDIERLQDLKVLVIGDAIIDEYVYASPLGIAGKGTHLVARCQESDLFLGGAFAVANHLASFSNHVTLLTAVGDDYKNYQLDDSLNPSIEKQYVVLNDRQTLLKRRYVQKDGENLSKLFETYSCDDLLVGESETSNLVAKLKSEKSDYDLVVVADFGNGFINKSLNEAISNFKTFLAINTQINSGNRGYHVVTKYERADYISLNEPEIRLTVHDLYANLEHVASKLAADMKSKYISVTRGVRGVSMFDQNGEITSVPALTQKVVDRVGAGDSYFALSSLALAGKMDVVVAGFLGSAAAAMDVQIIGNKKCIEKIPFLKYINTLMK